MTPTEVPFDRDKYQAAIHDLYPAVKNLIKTVAMKHDADPMFLAGILFSHLILNAFKVPRSYEVKKDELRDRLQSNPSVAS